MKKRPRQPVASVALATGWRAPVVRQDYRLIVAVENGNTNITFRVTKGASGAEISSGEQEPHFINP